MTHIAGNPHDIPIILEFLHAEYRLSSISLAKRDYTISPREARDRTMRCVCRARSGTAGEKLPLIARVSKLTRARESTRSSFTVFKGPQQRADARAACERMPEIVQVILYSILYLIPTGVFYAPFGSPPAVPTERMGDPYLTSPSS